MPLNLRLKSASRLPIDVRHLSTAVNDGLDTASVVTLPVFVGKKLKTVGDIFNVKGDLANDHRLEIGGDLSNVHSIGRGLAAGIVVIESSAGRHVGTSMSGGQITVQGNAGNYLGAGMTGGAIRVTRNAGDFAGAALEGAKHGMNRGEILIEGNAGVALGRRMRRGMIVVGGDVGELAAWDMLAGTIIIVGRSSNKTATDIKRGTVVLAGDGEESEDGTNYQTPRSKILKAEKRSNSNHGNSSKTLGAAFTAGGTSQPQIIQFLGTWLKRHYPETLSSAVEEKLFGRPFIKYNGADLNQNRAEIFIGR